MINRVPKIVAGILRVLHQHKLLGRHVIVAGTNAVYACEAAAGVFLDSALVATQDMDILWDTRPARNLLTMEHPENKGLLGILRKVDKTFELLQAESFRAVNQNGYMVDLIKSEPRQRALTPWLAEVLRREASMVTHRAFVILEAISK